MTHAEGGIRVMVLDAKGATATECSTPQEALALCGSRTVWIDISGADREAALNEVAKDLGIHPLFVADALEPGQRGKVDEIDGVTLLLFNMVEVNEAGVRESESMALFLSGDVLVSVQATRLDPFERLRKGILESHHPALAKGPDYLASQLVATLTDSFYAVVESITDEAEELEDLVYERPDQGTLKRIQRLRKDLLAARRAVWPYREVLGHCWRETHHGIRPATRKYFRDCYDTSVMVIDLVESAGDSISALSSIYTTVVGNKLNGTMRMLTALSAIFIPLTFISGMYGMNFNPSASRFNMPELNAKYGYVVVVGIMAVIAIGQFLYFWRKGWLFDSEA